MHPGQNTQEDNMAFRIKKPIIQGTETHRSALKAADAGLVAAAAALGKSYTPKPVDFTIEKRETKPPKEEERTDAEKELLAMQKLKLAKLKAKKKAEKNKLKEDAQAKKKAEREANRRRKSKEKKTKEGPTIVDGVKTVIGGVAVIPAAIGYGLYKAGKWVVNEVGDIVKDVNEHIKNKKAENQKEWEAEQIEKQKIQAEKDANYVGKGHVDDPETDYKNTKRYKDIIKKEEEDAKKAEFEATKAANKPITLEPRSIRALPTNKQKIELQKSTGTVNTMENTDRQFDKLDAHIKEKRPDIDPNTEEGKKEYRELYEQMTYDEATDEWKVPHIEVDSLITQEHKQDAANMYQVPKGDVVLQDDGSYAPREGAMSNYGDTWGDMGDGTMGWLDDGKEQYYSPDGQKMTKEAAERYGEEVIKKAEETKQRKLEIEEKNKAIRARNKTINDAKEYFGVDTIKASQLKEYEEMLAEEAADEKWLQENEIIEKDDPEPWDDDWDVEKHGSLREKREHQEKQASLDKIEAGYGGGVTDLVQEEPGASEVAEANKQALTDVTMGNFKNPTNDVIINSNEEAKPLAKDYKSSQEHAKALRAWYKNKNN